MVAATASHACRSTQAEELPPLPDRGDGAKGVLPRVLKNIISKRREVKGLLKKEKNVKKRETYEIRQMALKLTANSMYGCLGFSHSRFYAKPLAALVTSLGRDTLQATADVAEKELGLEVIYGDTDSIMINTRTDDLSVVKDLGLKVKKAVNKRYRLLELELDGIFKTMRRVSVEVDLELFVRAATASHAAATPST
ncbi:MAG: hypothetical protein CMN75_00705 [Spirochaeta sp.]|nr:hypothetical protein [Spirochaeta sp.]